MELNEGHGFKIIASKLVSKGEQIPINLEEVLAGEPPIGFYVSEEDYDEILELLTKKEG